MESSYVSFREVAHDMKEKVPEFNDIDFDYNNNNGCGIENKENHFNCPTMTTTTDPAATEAMFGDVDGSFLDDGESTVEAAYPPHPQEIPQQQQQARSQSHEEPHQDNTIDTPPPPDDGFTTPDGSMLDDSLLLSTSQEVELLHEIPVTPVKGMRPIYVNNNNNMAQQQQEEELACLEIMPEEPEPVELQVGDHVYQWRSWMGIPGIFQHHGIVMDIIEEYDSDAVDAEIPRRKLTIADFSNVPDAAKKEGRTGLTQQGILRTYTDTDRWHKVHYDASWWKRAVYRAGTCTSSKSDAVGLVLARVHFIIQHPDALPDYHVVNANCECVAFWCKTGKWSTLQASSFLEMTAAGQVKSTATLAGVASSAQVSVPSAGMWGWMGYTTQVSYLSMHPIVLPALAGYAVVTVGIPAVMYANAKKKWKETSQRLSDSFWASAMENPDVFAECITHWSEKR